mmetsp:Transcript_16095/g.26786  ORF Transcript_16095/g.26786 Transcript_16095/m.26786 type:complete len:105 (-) Transcript_16095:1800-2114(-)
MTATTQPIILRHATYDKNTMHATLIYMRMHTPHADSREGLLSSSYQMPGTIFHFRAGSKETVPSTRFRYIKAYFAWRSTANGAIANTESAMSTQDEGSKPECTA